MYSELTNLVPTDRRRAIRREYFVRLVTVALWLLVVIVIIQGIFLLPSYIYESQTVNSRTLSLRSLTASSATSQQQQLQASLNSLQSESTYLLALGKSPAASTALRAVLAVPRPGITLSGFTFTSPTVAASNSNRSMQLTGVAATREDLSAYNTALSALPFVSNSNLPISDFAMDSKIPFNITLTGTLTP